MLGFDATALPKEISEPLQRIIARWENNDLAENFAEEKAIREPFEKLPELDDFLNSQNKEPTETQLTQHKDLINQTNRIEDRLLKFLKKTPEYDAAKIVAIKRVIPDPFFQNGKIGHAINDKKKAIEAERADRALNELLKGVTKRSVLGGVPPH